MKRSHQASSSEELARRMRERAKLIELEESGDKYERKAKTLPKPVYKSVEERIEELKKVYFNAGRWAGGARDYKARQAFEQLSVVEA